METTIRYEVVTRPEPGTLFSGAWAIQRAIMDLKDSRNMPVETSKIVKIVETRVGADDFEGLGKVAITNPLTDLEARKEDSPVSRLVEGATQEDTILNAEKLHQLATLLVSKEVKIPGIGPKKARRVLEDTETLLRLASAYPDTSQVA